MEKKVCLFVRKILRERRRVERGGGGKQCEDWVTIISSSLSDIVISIFSFLSPLFLSWFEIFNNW